MRRPTLILMSLVPLLASCSMFEINKPLFSNDKQRGEIFPLFTEKNQGKPILQTDRVKTEAEAVELGRHNCGNEAADVRHWYATQSGDVWIVRWNVGENSIYAKVRKSDGTFDACEVNDPAR